MRRFTPIFQRTLIPELRQAQARRVDLALAKRALCKLSESDLILGLQVLPGEARPFLQTTHASFAILGLVS